MKWRSTQVSTVRSRGGMNGADVALRCDGRPCLIASCAHLHKASSPSAIRIPISHLLAQTKSYKFRAIDGPPTARDQAKANAFFNPS